MCGFFLKVKFAISLLASLSGKLFWLLTWSFLNTVHQHDIAVSKICWFSFLPRFGNCRKNSRWNEDENQDNSHPKMEKNLVCKKYVNFFIPCDVIRWAASEVRIISFCHIAGIWKSWKYQKLKIWNLCNGCFQNSNYFEDFV